MPHEVMGWRATDGSMHDTWAAAAEVEAVGLMMAILPVGLECREQLARQMARALFIDRDRAMVTGIAGLMDLMQTEPAPKPRLAVDNSAKPAQPRSWMRELLSNAGTTSG